MPQSDDQIQNFLNVIRQIESSGGKNLDHPEMQSGIQAGDAGIGQYGMMPNTIREIATRSAHEGTSNPDIMAAGLEPDPVAMKQTLEQNPDVEDQFASHLAGHLLDKFGGDEEKAAYAWNQGHNLSPDQVVQRNYQTHPYVNKFHKLKSLMTKQAGD